MSSHSDFAEIIHATLTRLAVGYPGPDDANEAHAALDALLADRDRLAGQVDRYEGLLDSNEWKALEEFAHRKDQCSPKLFYAFMAVKSVIAAALSDSKEEE